MSWRGYRPPLRRARGFDEVRQHFAQLDAPPLVDAAVRGDAGGHRANAFLDRDRRGRALAQRRCEREMLEVGRAEMLAGEADTLVPDATLVDAAAGAGRLAPVRAPAPVVATAVAQRQRRQQRLELARVADDRKLLAVDAALGEHAKVEHRADAARVLDDRERAVEDVGRAARVALVEGVDALAARRVHRERALAGNEVHQVEIVAALLDQRAAGVGVEAVPVADLRIERLAVLAD